ncbi:MAG: hypothetical protein ACLVIY_09445 [Anaerobutyricum soehngenii]
MRHGIISVVIDEDEVLRRMELHLDELSANLEEIKINSLYSR